MLTEEHLKSLIAMFRNTDPAELVRDHPALLAVAISHHGSWGNALRAHNLARSFILPEVRLRMRPKRMVLAKELREWCRSHGPLSEAALTATAPELMEALREASVQLDTMGTRLGVPVLMGPDLGQVVICLLCGRELMSLISHIPRIHAMSCDDYKTRFGVDHVVSIAQRRANATREDYTPLNKEELSARLRSLEAENPDFGPDWLRKNHPALDRQARYLWPSWRQLRRDLGMKPGLQQWTKQKIVAQVRRIMRTSGRSVITQKEVQQHDTRLLQALLSRFDSWDSFVLHLGLRPEDCRERRVWTRDKMCDALREWVAENGPLSATRLLQSDSGLHTALRAHFASLAVAARELDLPYEHRGGQSWTPQRVLEAIAAAYEPGSGVMPQKQHPRLAGAAAKYFELDQSQGTGRYRRESSELA